MIWRFVLPGQPPSLNDLYEIGWRHDKRGRRYKGIVKNRDAQRYHDDAVPQIRVAKPSRWNPEGQIRLRIRLYLADDIDADNTLKVLSDAIQTATGINDRRFLPCIEIKQTGFPKKLARVEVEVDDLALSGSPSRPPDSSPPPLAASASPSSSPSVRPSS